jgi:hypothetical protein
MNKLYFQFWKWPGAIIKLTKIREISSVYFNDSKFIKITEIIDE